MKKLQDISFTKTDVVWFAYRNNASDIHKYFSYNPFPLYSPFRHLPIHPFNIFTSSNFDFAKHVYDSVTTPKMSLVIAAKKSGIHFVRDYYGDSGVIVAGFAYLRNYPEAQKMLWHYLTGKGEEVEVDTERVLKEDQELKKFIIDSVVSEMNDGKKKGSVNATQNIYSNENWRNAFGSINVKWVLENNDIKLWIEDLYAWHPNEPRKSQALHQAMAKAQSYGASPFKYHGTFFNQSISV